MNIRRPGYLRNLANAPGAADFIPSESLTQVQVCKGNEECNCPPGFSNRGCMVCDCVITRES